MFHQLLQLLIIIPLVTGRGLMLLYRPKDVSNECVLSHLLRYDLSYGMGMSDTITLVFRNMKEIDYQCIIEIVTDTNDVYIIIVIHFPNSIDTNCGTNKNAFTVLKKNRCLAICDLTENRDTNSPYFIISVKSRIRFRFLSNSSVNSDMDANVYQVTATAARMMPETGCNIKNESVCAIDSQQYCFTSYVVCDGVKNCGVTDWFDERKAECLIPIELLGYAPVAAVVAVTLCVLLAASHLMLRYLPLSANSFFIFNANEDNRLCIDPVFKAPDPTRCDFEKPKRTSLIPVSSSSSDESRQVKKTKIIEQPNVKSKSSEALPPSPEEPPEPNTVKDEKQYRRKTTMRTMTEIIQQRLRSVTNRGRSLNTDGGEYI